LAESQNKGHELFLVVKNKFDVHLVSPEKVLVLVLVILISGERVYRFEGLCDFLRTFVENMVKKLLKLRRSLELFDQGRKSPQNLQYGHNVVFELFFWCLSPDHLIV
jgi:hypothetical protein